MKTKVNAAKILRTVLNLQKGGLNVSADYGYSRSRAFPMFIFVSFDASKTLSRSSIEGFTQNGYVLVSIRAKAPSNVDIEAVFERGTA